MYVLVCIDKIITSLWLQVFDMIIMYAREREDGGVFIYSRKKWDLYLKEKETKSILNT